MFTPLCFVIFFISCHFLCGNSRVNETIIEDYLKPGMCKGLWRPQRLLGRCFGLTLHSVFPELSSIKIVESAKQCKSICCNLQEKCINWQYQQASKQCKLGKDLVRLGTEGYNSPYWCDPLPTSNMWLGNKLLKVISNISVVVVRMNFIETIFLSLSKMVLARGRNKTLQPNALGWGLRGKMRPKDP